jgi:hypothetical protein
LPTLRKNEGTISLFLDFPHAEAKHIASGLKTESDFIEDHGIILILISSNNFLDFRVIWNSIMRGIIVFE